MKNIELKQKLLKDKTLYQDYLRCKRVIYKFVYKNSVPYEVYRQAIYDLGYLSRHYKAEIKECYNLLHNRCQRVTRLKKKVSDMISTHDCIFLTFTWSDKTYNKCQSKRKRVQEFLNNLHCNYIANVDFGSDRFYTDKYGVYRQATSREHYHALVQIDYVDYSTWHYGALKGVRVRNEFSFDSNGELTDKSVVRLAKYVAKFTNHAIKESCRGTRIMYNRKHYK